MKRFIYLAVAAALGGCSDKSYQHLDDALAASSAGHYRECVDQATIAIDIVRGDRKNSLGMYSLKTIPPNHGAVKIFLTNLGDFLAVRADCRRKLGQLPDAIADMEKSVQAHAEACHQKSDLSKTVCRAAADHAEVLAKWKKESAQSKP